MCEPLEQTSYASLCLRVCVSHLLLTVANATARMYHKPHVYLFTELAHSMSYSILFKAGGNNNYKGFAWKF